MSSCGVSRIVAGQDRSIAFGLTYSNAGPEEARNLELVITDVPPSAVGNVQIAGQMVSLVGRSFSVWWYGNAGLFVVALMTERV